MANKENEVKTNGAQMAENPANSQETSLTVVQKPGVGTTMKVVAGVFLCLVGGAVGWVLKGVFGAARGGDGSEEPAEPATED